MVNKHTPLFAKLLRLPWCLSIVVLLFSFSAHGQPKEYVLKGYAQITGERGAHKFQLIFSLKGAEITGYSLTDQPDGAALKATITGSLDTRKQTLSFRESKMDMITVGDACLFESKMSHSNVADHHFLAGDFRGKDVNGKECGRGAIVFELPDGPGSLFDTEVPAQQPVPKKAPAPEVAVKKETVPEVKSEAPAEMRMVTATQQQQYEWNSDTCIVEIWDGEVADGDAVTVVFNKHKVLENYGLTVSRKQVILPLKGKVNTLTIVAESEGKAPPCTSRVMLYDGRVHHEVMARIEKGQSADIVIRRK